MAKKAASKPRSSKAQGEGGEAGRPPFEPVPPLWLAPDDTPPEERARQQAQYERDHAAWRQGYDAWWRRHGPQYEKAQAEGLAKAREEAGRLPPGFLSSEPLLPQWLGPGSKSMEERERERRQYQREHDAWERERGQYLREYAAWERKEQALLRQQELEQQLDARAIRAVAETLLGGRTPPVPSAPAQETSPASAQGAPRPPTAGRKPHPDRDAIVALHKQLLTDNSQQTLKATVAEVNKQVAEGLLKRGVGTKTLGEWLHRDAAERK